MILWQYVLEELVQQHGGNCMFISVFGSEFKWQANVCALDEHGADHSQFVPQSNEPFDQEDAYIESVADQHDLRWQQYLTRLSLG